MAITTMVVMRQLEVALQLLQEARTRRVNTTLPILSLGQLPTLLDPTNQTS